MTVLPDGRYIFKPKMPIWVNFKRCWSFRAILSIVLPNGIHILWPFGTFCGHLGYFSPFGMLYREKSGNPGV
jgi:hypothetical protein